MNRAMIILITAILSTTFVATEVFGLGFGIFRKHKRPFKKPRVEKVEKVESVITTVPITLAFDSLKSLEENGPVYVLQFKLFNTGQLELSMFIHENRFSYSEPGEALGKTTTILTKQQMHLALQQVKTIANTPINVKKNKNLCGVIPSIDKGVKALFNIRNFDIHSNTFVPGLKLVENTKGCWAEYSVSPTENKEAFMNLRNLLNRFARPSIKQLIHK